MKLYETLYMQALSGIVNKQAQEDCFGESEKKNSIALCFGCYYLTSSEGWEHNRIPWSPRRWATPRGLGQRT